MNIFRLLVLLLVTSAIVSCSDKGPQFVVEGKISDADSTTLYLERRELNKVTVLDSAKLDATGNFKFKESSTLYPEFYVLRLNNQIINFAVDSTATVKVESSRKTFGTGYNIEGGYGNMQIKDATLAQYKANSDLKILKEKYAKKEISDDQYLNQVQEIAKKYKEKAIKIISSDFRSPAGYFALFQKVDGYLFFDPYEKKDNRLFAAVATAWDNSYSRSPRASHVKDYTLIAINTIRQNQPLSDDVINSAKEINASDYYNVELTNTDGEIVKLSSLQGKVVLLDFTLYQNEDSPMRNIALNELYNKFKPNLEIYQVSFDSDLHFWKNAAVNLPWTTVVDNESLNSKLIFKFNIQSIPTMFLLDRQGNIVKRILPSDNIEAEIKKAI